MLDAGPKTRDSHTCRCANSLSYECLLIAANRISKIREDEPKLTTLLTASPAPWSEVAGTYDLDFGKALKGTTEVRQRDLSGIGDGLKSFGQRIVNGAKQGADAVANGAKILLARLLSSATKLVIFSVAVGKPNQATISLKVLS